VNRVERNTLVRGAGWFALAWMALSVAGIAMAPAASASTARCAGPMKVTAGLLGGLGGLTLSPASEKVQAGGCVSFDNTTGGQVQVTVSGASAFSHSLPAKAVVSFTPGKPGRDTVKVTGLTLSPASGSITVTAVPSRSPSPSPTRTATAPSAGHSSTPATHPDVAPSPKRSGHSSALPTPTGVALPPLPPLPASGQTAIPLGSNPVVAPGPTSAAPAVSVTTSASPAALAGPIEPAANDRRGLPEVVGIVLVIGLGTAWARAALASTGPVDDDPDVSHRL
jgi:hypothetical protein